MPVELDEVQKNICITKQLHCTWSFSKKKQIIVILITKNKIANEFMYKIIKILQDQHNSKINKLNKIINISNCFEIYITILKIKK